jgi:hypothetical protein
MGGCCSCCAGDDEEEEETRGSLLNKGGSPTRGRSLEARRKAAEAALRRAGALAQRGRPKAVAATNARAQGKSMCGEGMRWEAG